MGNYVYAYQKDAIQYALDSVHKGRPLPASAYQNLNATVRFKNRTMGPLHLFNTADNLCMIFTTASDMITFLNLWRKNKTWKPPAWATEKAKKKKEFLHDKKQQEREAELGVPSPPIIIQALQECITFKRVQSPSGSSNSTLGTITPASLLACIDESITPLPSAPPHA
ncbi:hypothetical protein OG21DRAFT_1486633 [Imleria badia]|nr:hypothetical protein OG21DRAFT_1486633 [Imleria badia]